MIICVTRRSGVRRAELAVKEDLTVAVCLGTLAGVMPDSAVAFIPSGSSGDTCLVENFGGKTEESSFHRGR